MGFLRDFVTAFLTALLVFGAAASILLYYFN